MGCITLVLVALSLGANTTIQFKQLNLAGKIRLEDSRALLLKTWFPEGRLLEKHNLRPHLRPTILARVLDTGDV